LARVIAAAAVDLFERKGFAETTVDDIAAEAGISRTTFFRHCATKEAAVLVDDAGLESALVEVAQQTATQSPLRVLESAWEKMTAVFDDDPDGRDRFLRVRRLMRISPPLLAAALAREAQLTERIAAALRDRPDVGELQAHTIASIFATGMRVAFDEWTRRADDEPGLTPPSLSVVYREVRDAIENANDR
jgi:AcrR family transcriptional regulator